MPLEPTLRVLNLGAGVQSSTLLLMSLHGTVTPRPDCAIFADTQWEPQSVYDHLNNLESIAKQFDFPIYRVTFGNIKKDVLTSISEQKSRVDQPPFFIKTGERQTEGRLFRKCTRAYKIMPIHLKVREMLGVTKGARVKKGTLVEQWYGISLDEMQRMKTSSDKWIQFRYPLIEQRMSRHDCLQWMIKNHYPLPSKSACIGCPYHKNDFYRTLKSESPEEWQDLVSFDQSLRQGNLPNVKGEAFVHRSLMPIDQVDLSTEEDRGQLSLWNDECDGICNV